MANVTLKLAPDVLAKARYEAAAEKRSLSKQVELWIEQATKGISSKPKRGTTIRKGERV